MGPEAQKFPLPASSPEWLRPAYNFPMHKDLRSLLDDSKQDVSGRFTAIPEDLDPDKYVDIELG